MSTSYLVNINNEDVIMEVADTSFGTIVVAESDMAQVTVMGGVAGPPGTSGASGAGFNFTQSSPSTTWIINHNLGFRPSVDLFSIGGVEMLAEVVHMSVNQTVVNFNEAVSGFARLT